MIAEHAARTLATLAERDSGVAQAIAEAGGVERAVALLEPGARNEPGAAARIEVARLLSHVARLEAWRGQVFAMAHESLLGLLDATQTADERLHEWAARTLRQLIVESDENRRAFAAKRDGEGLFLLVTLLGSENAALVEHVILMLETLAKEQSVRVCWFV